MRDCLPPIDNPVVCILLLLGDGLRAELRQMRIVVLCRTGVIHDPVRQTCIFDTEWSSGSSGGGRRLVEAIEAVECAVDPSEVTQELGTVKQQAGKAAVETTEVKKELSEVKMELGEVKQQLRKAEESAENMQQQLRNAEEVAADMKRKAEQAAKDMKRQVGDMSGELHEIKALLKQLATAQ